MFALVMSSSINHCTALGAWLTNLVFASYQPLTCATCNIVFFVIAWQQLQLQDCTKDLHGVRAQLYPSSGGQPFCAKLADYGHALALGDCDSCVAPCEMCGPWYFKWGMYASHG